MATAKTIAELEKEFHKRLNKALPAVAEIIKREMRQSIQDVVYDAGEPEYYKRRGASNGGLQAESSLRADYGELTVDVYEDAHAQGKNFDPLDEHLEFGYGDQSQWYNQPRPFMETAQKYVNAHEKEIQREVDKIVNG